MPPLPPPPPSSFYNPFLQGDNSPASDIPAQNPISSSSSSGAGAHRTHSNNSFSATKRSLQARAKNYHAAAADRGHQGREYEERQSRDRALRVLESEELLMWIAASRNESIPQTRSHYRNIVLGLSDLEDKDLVWLEEWEVGATNAAVASPARSAKGKERDVLKKREGLSGRMSL